MRMAEYIEREAALNRLCQENCDHDYVKDKCQNCYVSAFIEYAPAADVVPVVHGGWMAVKDFGGGHCVGFCNKCRTIHTASSATALKLEYRFCRWCGARMDGE